MYLPLMLHSSGGAAMREVPFFFFLSVGLPFVAKGTVWRVIHSRENHAFLLAAALEGWLPMTIGVHQVCVSRPGVSVRDGVETFSVLSTAHPVCWEIEGGGLPGGVLERARLSPVTGRKFDEY